MLLGSSDAPLVAATLGSADTDGAFEIDGAFEGAIVIVGAGEIVGNGTGAGVPGFSTHPATRREYYCESFIRKSKNQDVVALTYQT